MESHDLLDLVFDDQPADQPSPVTGTPIIPCKTYNNPVTGKSMSDPSGDMTLRTSDGYTWKIKSVYLKAASNVFSEMIEKSPHLLTFPETGPDFHAFLHFLMLHHIERENLHSPEHATMSSNLHTVVTLLSKYRCDGFLAGCEAQAQAILSLNGSPWWIFVAACRQRWQYTAKLAIRQLWQVELVGDNGEIKSAAPENLTEEEVEEIGLSAYRAFVVAVMGGKKGKELGFGEEAREEWERVAELFVLKKKEDTGVGRVGMGGVKKENPVRSSPGAENVKINTPYLGQPSEPTIDFGSLGTALSPTSITAPQSKPALPSSPPEIIETSPKPIAENWMTGFNKQPVISKEVVVKLPASVGPPSSLREIVRDLKAMSAHHSFQMDAPYSTHLTSPKWIDLDRPSPAFLLASLKDLPTSDNPTSTLDGEIVAKRVGDAAAADSPLPKSHDTQTPRVSTSTSFSAAAAKAKRTDVKEDDWGGAPHGPTVEPRTTSLPATPLTSQVITRSPRQPDGSPFKPRAAREVRKPVENFLFNGAQFDELSAVSSSASWRDGGWAGAPVRQVPVEVVETASEALRGMSVKSTDWVDYAKNYLTPDSGTSARLTAGTSAATTHTVTPKDPPRTPSLLQRNPPPASATARYLTPAEHSTPKYDGGRFYNPKHGVGFEVPARPPGHTYETRAGGYEGGYDLGGGRGMIH